MIRKLTETVTTVVQFTIECDCCGRSKDSFIGEKRHLFVMAAIKAGWRVDDEGGALCERCASTPGESKEASE